MIFPLSQFDVSFRLCMADILCIVRPYSPETRLMAMTTAMLSLCKYCL